ncbi:hypothetical protein [Ligaoa zhengdingensis]|uniref:hypothetical protein n=1 Tax=Ligaoa zhengdingensis TaxID=2763658 RepID=UPI0031BB2366
MNRFYLTKGHKKINIKLKLLQPSRGGETPPGMRPGALPKKTLIKAWGTLPEASK